MTPVNAILKKSLLSPTIKRVLKSFIKKNTCSELIPVANPAHTIVLDKGVAHTISSSSGDKVFPYFLEVSQLLKEKK